MGSNSWWLKPWEKHLVMYLCMWDEQAAELHIYDLYRYQINIKITIIIQILNTDTFRFFFTVTVKYFQYKSYLYILLVRHNT